MTKEIKKERFAFCPVCKSEYDPLIYDMGERCAIPRKKEFGAKGVPYCNGKLILKERIFELQQIVEVN
tara:strand:- start:1959 stop:2162 length:204 start_codon:yes stop_codon:yes gene_type:complete